MDTTGGPKALTQEERRAFFDDLYERLSAPAEPPKRERRPDTEKYRAMRERGAMRARLKKLGADLRDAADYLERIHGDRSGRHHRHPLPLLASRWEGGPGAPGLRPRFERAQQEARDGSPIAAQFVAEHEALFLLLDHLRHERPPARAPDYDAIGEAPEHLREYFEQTAAETERRIERYLRGE